MYQDSKRTCTAIVLLIKPFVWRRSRCRRHRGFVNSLLTTEYLKDLRERHNHKHKAKESTLSPGDVVLTKD